MRERGVLIRDRLGIKPLYYAIVDGLVVFGSELKCVLASGVVSAELDPEAIAAFLTLGYVPGAMTPLKHVRKLEPGERLVVAERPRDASSAGGSYPAPAARPVERSTEEWAEIVLDKLDESVRMRLMSDVPLGAMLSGGLDSSLIVALMAQHMSQPVDTFAVGFAGEDSELPDARRVADALGADHHELEVALDTDPDELARLIWHLDEPLADLSSLGFLALSALRRRARDGGAVRARARTSCSAATASTASPRSPSTGAACPAPSARAPAPRSGAGPAAPAGWRTRWRRRTPPRACWPRAGSSTPSCAASSSAARWRSTPAPPSACCADGSRGAPGAAPARGRALPRRAARARRRHAHVLRPRVDGVLARGARAVPRPRARRAVRPDPDGRTRSAGCRASTSSGAPPAGRVPDFVLEKRKRGFFNEAVGTLGRRRGRRARRRSAARPGPRVRGRSSTPPRSARAVARVARGPGAATRTCCSRW